jgi:hypothetical protein
MLHLSMPKSAVWPAMTISALGALGGVLLASTYLYLIEQYVCREHYIMMRPEMVGGGGRIDESLCKEPAIQSTVAGIQGTLIFLTIMPGECIKLQLYVIPLTLSLGLFLAGPWGRIAKIIGKKTVLLLVGCSTTCQAIFYMVVCEYQLPFQLIKFLNNCSRLFSKVLQHSLGLHGMPL